MVGQAPGCRGRRISHGGCFMSVSPDREFGVYHGFHGGLAVLAGTLSTLGISRRMSFAFPPGRPTVAARPRAAADVSTRRPALPGRPG